MPAVADPIFEACREFLAAGVRDRAADRMEVLRLGFVVCSFAWSFNCCAESKREAYSATTSFAWHTYVCECMSG